MFGTSPAVGDKERQMTEAWTTRGDNRRSPGWSVMVVGSVATLMVASLVSGCLSPFERGEAYYDAGEYEDAREQVERGLEKSPEDPEMNLLMAETLVAQKDYEKAQTYAETAADAEATRGEGARVLGKIHWELGRALQAVEAWRTAREVDPELVSDEDWIRALEAAIDDADTNHEHREALRLRESLAELRPDHSEVGDEIMVRTRRRYAEALVENGEYEEAADIYRTLAEATDAGGNYVYERGRLLLRLKRPDEAREAFDAYADLAPSDKRLERLLKLARRARDRNAPRLALRYFQQAIDEIDGEATFRRAKLRLTLATLLFEVGSNVEAREQIKTYLDDMRQLRGEPLGGEVYLTAADTASEAGRNGFAVDLLEEALDKAPPTWSVTSRLAQQYAVQARREDAQRVLNTFIDRADSTADALKHAARWARERRNYNLAKSYYERLLEVAPDQSDTWMELGELYAELGQIEKMKNALDTFVDKHDDNRQDLLDVTSIYLDRKLYQRAEQVLRKVRENHPESLLVVDRFAELYRKWGKPERIQEAYRTWIEARGEEASDYQLVGERLLRRRKLRQALPFFKQAAENGIPDAWLQIADIYQNQRRELDMKEALDSYLEVAEDRTAALRAALSRYRSSSLTREATEILQELIDREPEVKSHYERLGESYLSQGRQEAAFDLWRKYVDNASDTMTGLSTVSRWFEQAGEPMLTLKFYRHWLGDEETDPELYRLMGEAYMQLAPRRWNRRRTSGPSREDAIKHARRYYRRYLEEAEAEPNKLEAFATSMRENELWAIAAEAYARIVTSAPANSILQLQHAESLLHLGEADRAMREYKEYYRARGETPEDAKKIADELFEFRYLKRAEPYLDRMFSSSNGEYVQTAFVKLTETYQHTDRSDRISGLVTDFLNRASNPAKGRQLAVQVLKRRGLYEEAAHQIERIREFQGNVMGFELGANFFRAGDIERAREAFANHAEESPYSGAVLLKIGQFYERHARPELAVDAYTKAIEAAPDDFKPREARGRFHLLRGNFEQGQADFQAALDRAESKRNDDIRKTQVETLEAIGRFERAAQTAREALTSASRHRGFFLRQLAEHELKTGEASRVNRIIERLSQSSIALEDVVSMLVDHGYRRAAADLIDEELDAGNFSSAGRAMVNRPGVFTRLGGIDKLERAARPLLKQNDAQSSLRAQIGEFFIRQGHEQKGIVFLRSAMEDGHPLFRTVLAQTYAKLGETEQAIELFQRHLGDVPKPRRSRALQEVGARLQLADQRPAFENLLRNVARGDEYASTATDLHVELLAHAGDLDDALGTVERLTDRLAGGSDTSELISEGNQTVGRTLAALRGLASAGYRQEALRFYDRLPDELDNHPDVRQFGFHLAATLGGDRLDREIEQTRSHLGRLDVETARERRLDFADVLMANGRFDRAAQFVQPAVQSPDQRSSEAALRFMMRNAYARGESHEIRDLSGRLLEIMSDRLRSRARISSTLDTLGLDDQSLDQRLTVAERASTADHVNQALGTARAAGDGKSARQLVEQYLRVAEQPLSDLRPTFGRVVERQAPELVDALYAPYRRTRPAKLDVRLHRARAAFRFGDVEQGRSIIRGYLESVDYESAAVQRVLEFYDTNDLWAEQLDGVLPHVDDEDLTRESLKYLGIAYAELGRDGKAREYFDRAVEAAPETAERAASLAETLFEADLTTLAAEYGDQAVEADSTRPDGRLFRGLARLANGETEAAKPDLERGLDAGVNRLYGLYRAGRAALKGDKPDLAARYLNQLARTPSASDFDVLMPIRLALDAYRQTGTESHAVEFVEEQFPTLAAGDNVTGTSLSLYLSGLYEHAGRPERAYSIYENAIDRHLVRHPSETPTTRFMNNLAYTYATTNRHVDRGLDLVRRAIAGSSSRTPSYLDTLGWLQYRRDDLEEAERHIRRALRTSTGRGSELEELFDHLATLREARGMPGDAYWIRRFVESLE
jgi:tetratricopeptide (TPR) repeat protein